MLDVSPLVESFVALGTYYLIQCELTSIICVAVGDFGDMDFSVWD